MFGAHRWTVLLETIEGCRLLAYRSPRIFILTGSNNCRCLGLVSWLQGSAQLKRPPLLHLQHATCARKAESCKVRMVFTLPSRVHRNTTSSCRNVVPVLMIVRLHRLCEIIERACSGDGVHTVTNLSSFKTPSGVLSGMEHPRKRSTSPKRLQALDTARTFRTLCLYTLILTIVADTLPCARNYLGFSSDSILILAPFTAGQ